MDPGALQNTAYFSSVSARRYVYWRKAVRQDEAEAVYDYNIRIIVYIGNLSVS